MVHTLDNFQGIVPGKECLLTLNKAQIKKLNLVIITLIRPLFLNKCQKLDPKMLRPTNEQFFLPHTKESHQSRILTKERILELSQRSPPNF